MMCYSCLWLKSVRFPTILPTVGDRCSARSLGFAKDLALCRALFYKQFRGSPPQDGNKFGRHAPGRTANALSGREREYLTPGEVDRLVKTARCRGRYGQRDGLAILMAFRHGLRVSELVGLRWSQVDFATQRLTVHRLKGSLDATHPIAGDELRELRKLARSQETGTRFLFMTERGAPVSVA